MGARITRGAGLDLRLEKIAERSTRDLRHVHREGAEKLADTAREMAPVLEHRIENAIGVLETKEVGNRKTFTVEVDGSKAPHAVYMHEQIYNLGAKSQAKNATSQHQVGRKYMERAVAWLIREWRFYDKARAAVRKGKK